MKADIQHLNELENAEAVTLLKTCCGSTRWAREMAGRRPFDSPRDVLATADDVWETMGRDDILEAFSHHPQIGADIDELRRKFADTAAWSASEQSSVGGASDEVLERLRDLNQSYLDRFGYIFIVCATGKSAPEMLELLEQRIDNHPEDELDIAAAEQAKITKLRLEKLEIS